ncbi:Peroxisomal membrane protein PMP27 [Imshaugia aleurites]|uniref:Peroxisomal membrane protein PMP27 n=1 Tax=Imshaugia aleurites TaxID=172621 RepID=A0A8H3IP83_9LECA|nr:Peroxisomal membrane protein PMP27 [Imshaugia aleurites]
MVADAVVYHPTVAHYLRFVATTVGRDKLLRTLQYFSRFYAWYLFRTNNPARLIAPYEAIKKQFGLTRKALRLGKNVEHFKAAAVAADSKNMDPVLKYCAVGRQLGYAMYLSLDAVTYLDAAGIRPLASAKRLQQEAYRAWFTGLAFNAIAGLYTLWQLRQREQSIDKNEGEGVVESKKIMKERNTTNLQLISDLSDLTIPSAALGYVNLDDGIVGLAGTVSSLIGVWTTWKKTA